MGRCTNAVGLVLCGVLNPVIFIGDYRGQLIQQVHLKMIEN